MQQGVPYDRLLEAQVGKCKMPTFHISLSLQENKHLLLLQNKFILLNFVFFRLRIDKSGGAWCPKHMVSKEAKEYLQIDLLVLHVITGTLTQGRFGNGQGQEYAEEYMLDYWRPGDTKWRRWRNHTDKEVSKFLTTALLQVADNNK